jgi:OmpA-OmpF porin, OOP family
MGQNGWVRLVKKMVRLQLSILAILTWMTAMPARAQDEKGSVEAPVIGRYAGSRIYRQGVKAFDQASFQVGTGAPVKVEGKRVWTVYVGMKGRSALEVFRNYQQALTAERFRTVHTCSRNCGLFFRSALKDVEAPFFTYGDTDISDNHYLIASRATPGGTEYVRVGVRSTTDPVVLFDIVQPSEMERRIEVVTGSAMATDLNQRGRSLLYAIFFDFDSAVIKSESKPQLDELARFLRGAPSINIFVVGHTDGKGAVEYNSDLSRRRAMAITTALTKDYAISAARLQAYGVGELSPVATNDTDAGRAENRRVEIVKRID